MKKYYIDENIRFCYPYETSEEVENYGVLSKYMGKYFSQKEIDKIICELFMKHPYVENSMDLQINICWVDDESIFGFYHILSFPNEGYEKQKRGDLKIKYKN